MNNNEYLNNNGLNTNYNSIPYNNVQNNIKMDVNYNTSPNNKKANKKTILIILALIVFIGVVAFFILKLFGNGNSTSDLSSIFDPNKPIVVNSDGKYGYITSEGKTMIKPQYNSASDFYGNYAVVSVSSADAVTSNRIFYQIIDKKGNVKLKSNSYTAPKYYSTYDIWVVDDILYDSKLKRMSSEEIKVEYIDYEYFEYVDSSKKESGIMTYKGKKIFTTSGTSLTARISKNEYNEDDLYALVRTYGEQKKDVVISLKTGDVLFTSEDVENYYISEEDNGIFYYYNHNLDDGYKNKKYLFFIDNKLAYQTTEIVDEVQVYDYQNQILEIDYGYDYKILGKTRRRYYYDVKNKKMLESKPSLSESTIDLEIDLIEQTYGFKEYSSSGKYGLMAGEKIIVPCEYDDIDYLNSNVFNYMKSKGKELVLLEKDSKLVLYNLKKLKSITTFDSDYVYDYDNSTFIKVNLYAEDGYTITGYMVYNLLSGKSMTFGASDDISINSNYVIIKKDGKKIYYNTNLKQIYVTTES